MPNFKHIKLKAPGAACPTGEEATEHDSPIILLSEEGRTHMLLVTSPAQKQ